MSNTMLNIHDLLAVDAPISPLAVADVFGDCYLTEHNLIYRNVRSSAIESGFRYITDPATEIWSDYQLMSLACLERLMTTKCIPCYPTKRILNKLDDGHAFDRPVPLRFVLMALALNNHFHESAHALGYRALSQNPELVGALSRSESEGRVWGSIITEAVANTIDYFAWMISTQSVERIFLRLNSPASFEDPDLRGFARFVMGTFGNKFVFERVFASFLMGRLSSDITRPGIQEDLFRIFNEDKSDDRKGEITAILLRMAKGLRSDFRDVVAPSYFALLGVHSDYQAIVSRNFRLSEYAIPLRAFANACFAICYSERTNSTALDFRNRTDRADG